jgi:hypothetical protein
MVRNRSLVGGFALLATVTLALLHASAQGRGATPARTPDGKPDLAGIYSFSTVTPLQRPDALEGKATLTDEEAAEFEAAENTRLNRDLFDPEKGQPSAGYLPRAQGGVLSYNEFWYERGNKLTRDKRTSLIVDPPDGRIPFTDAARRRVAEMRQRSDSGLGDSYADRPLADRCLQGFNSGPPMTPGAYNNNVQIVQSPGVVVIVNEMVHNALPMGARIRRFASGRETRAADGKATRSSSRPSTSGARRACKAPARTRGWWSGSRQSTPRRSSTNSPSPTRRCTPGRGAQ